MHKLNSNETAIYLAEVADDRKASDVKILDITRITLVADYFVIASAPTSVRVKAISDAIAEKAKEKGLKILHSEGYSAGRWILMDYGAVIAHVFHEDDRKFYDLERLWGDAKVIDLAPAASK